MITDITKSIAADEIHSTVCVEMAGHNIGLIGLT